MSEHILISIAAVIGLGIGAQWIAWRIKMPSILLLLLVGFLAGPVTGLLEPASLNGDWVFAFVSISIGIILFEGGLSLRISELREVGKAVFNLITIGVLVTWVLSAVAAYYVLSLNLELSILLGAILTVTGPTVVIPLLRHVRPSGRVGTIAKWEGITIDPVGAILAVLVLGAIVFLNRAGEFGGAMQHMLEGVFLTFFVSIGVSLTGAALLLAVLKRRMVPDYLQNPVALMLVVATFAMSNHLQEESGLLSTTLMGIIIANQNFVAVRHIVEFKENLTVLLIGSLFILLSARLELDALTVLGPQSFVFLFILILIVRPVAVYLSGLRTKLSWPEKVFLSWLAPRGIVAAAVAALFSFRLEPIYPEQVRMLVPLVFLVIIGTVAIYGLTIAPLAYRLGLAEPHAQGVLFVGAHAWARRIAAVLHDLGFHVLMIDANADNIAASRELDLPAEQANALSERVIDDINLGGLGRILALTPNDEVNSLVVLNFSEFFDRNDVYQLASRSEARDTESELPKHLRGRALFGESTHFQLLESRHNRGDEIKVFTPTKTLPFSELEKHYNGEMIPLFIIHDKNNLEIVSERQAIDPDAGDRVLVMVPAKAELDETLSNALEYPATQENGVSAKETDAEADS